MECGTRRACATLFCCCLVLWIRIQCVAVVVACLTAWALFDDADQFLKREESVCSNVLHTRVEQWAGLCSCLFCFVYVARVYQFILKNHAWVGNEACGVWGLTCSSQGMLWLVTLGLVFWVACIRDDYAATSKVTSTYVQSWSITHLVTGTMPCCLQLFLR